VNTDDNTETTTATELPPPDDLLSITTLMHQELDPGLWEVLAEYRRAEVALQRAIDRLRELGRPKWALACSSRSRELQVQANRYIAAERARTTSAAP
jgi:hypothetical protein